LRIVEHVAPGAATAPWSFLRNGLLYGPTHRSTFALKGGRSTRRSSRGRHPRGGGRVGPRGYGHSGNGDARGVELVGDRTTPLVMRSSSMYPCQRYMLPFDRTFTAPM